MTREFYGLSEDFKTDQLLVRSENEKNKILYLVSDSVKQVLSATDVHKLRVIITLMSNDIRLFYFRTTLSNNFSYSL